MSFGDLLEALGRDAGLSIDTARCERLGGGFSETFRVASSRGRVFLKTTDEPQLAMLEAEAEGLAALRQAEAAAVPDTYAVGVGEGRAYLALQWIDFAESAGEPAQASLGRALAKQHALLSDRHGWHRSNTIGSTPQMNPPSTDWMAFYRDSRLGFQLRLAAAKGLDPRCVELGTRLMQGLSFYFDAHAPPPSLLHGDLWAGNWALSRSGVPYVFDPAVYFGDRETDLAMTRLFGGFTDAFYRAYQQAWALPAGWERRVDLYQLYHLLNHFNLFGAAYLPGVAACLSRLTAPL